MANSNDMDRNLPSFDDFDEPFADEPLGAPEVPAADEVDEQPAPAAESGFGKTAGALSASAADTARTFVEGISAMRDVSRAKREHNAARSRLEALKVSIEEMQAELNHRTDIERNYDTIMAEQGEALARAHAEFDDAQERIDALNAQHARLSDQLAKLKVDNEARLRPYKNLMESTRSRAEDTSRALKEVQRAVKDAESALAKANSLRDSQVSRASRDVDNANARLARLNEQLASLSSAAQPDTATIEQVKQSIANEQIHLSTARSEVQATRDEAQRAVDSAQAHLLTQQQSLDIAERNNEAARKEAEERRAEYERLYQDAQTDEAKLDNAVVEREMGVRDVTKEQLAAQDRMDAAQALLDEANDIHSTPDKTQRLRSDITAALADLDAQSEKVRSLAGAERDLRESTKRSRAIFMAIVGAALLVVLFVLWLIFGSGCSRKPKTDDTAQPAPAATQPAQTEEGKVAEGEDEGEAEGDKAAEAGKADESADDTSGEGTEGEGEGEDIGSATVDG
ncbi:MAG: hypothetical protein IKG69_04625 [Atopobiaceae bacterium]|nr:hypothetical protein [Atopobiaceae bacterium]